MRRPTPLAAVAVAALLALTAWGAWRVDSTAVHSSGDSIAATRSGHDGPSPAVVSSRSGSVETVRDRNDSGRNSWWTSLLAALLLSLAAAWSASREGVARTAGGSRPAPLLCCTPSRAPPMIPIV
ncbi:MAG: hypothetical protein U0Q22_13735 [Acidimicrobiales bacterium]